MTFPGEFLSKSGLPPRFFHHWLVIGILGLLAIALWDLSSLDTSVAYIAGGSTGFPWRENYWFDNVLHKGARNLAWIAVLMLIVGALYPFGILRSLPLLARLQLPAVTLISAGTISLLKYWSNTSCPWDLAMFGGSLTYVSHWNMNLFDGGSGHCFPAGHASTGFAFLGGYFVLRRYRPRLAMWWVAVTIGVGMILGIAQQLRGAHFMSHTLWTAWICWMLGGLVDSACHPRAKI